MLALLSEGAKTTAGVDCENEAHAVGTLAGGPSRSLQSQQSARSCSV
jgi:hypothetical protein